MARDLHNWEKKTLRLNTETLGDEYQKSEALLERGIALQISKRVQNLMRSKKLKHAPVSHEDPRERFPIPEGEGRRRYLEIWKPEFLPETHAALVIARTLPAEGYPEKLRVLQTSLEVFAVDRSALQGRLGAIELVYPLLGEEGEQARRAMSPLLSLNLTHLPPRKREVEGELLELELLEFNNFDQGGNFQVTEGERFRIAGSTIYDYSDAFYPIGYEGDQQNVIVINNTLRSTLNTGEELDIFNRVNQRVSFLETILPFEEKRK